jgi:hypothetical protein
VVVVVLVVAAALLIHGCQVSQTNDSLKTYASTVNSQIGASNGNGQYVFNKLKSGESTGNITDLANQLASALGTARTELTEAEDLSAPSQMSSAQQSFVDTMKLRYNGISQIANNIQGAMASGTAVDGVNAIATGTSMLYASDVVYKTSVGTGIAAALNAAGLPIGGTTGASINAGQVVPDLGWLNPTTVAIWLAAPVPSKEVNGDQPGLHGHSLNSVSVGSTVLDPSGTNTIPDTSAPTFTLSLTNGGLYNEIDVKCRVWIVGGNDSQTVTIPETFSHQATTCDVTLPTAPAAGTPWLLKAEVLPVRGEKNIANNTLSYTVDFN